MDSEKPRPGSKEAIDIGCTCPVIDNHHGEGIPMVHPTTKEVQRAYWINAECIIHGTKEK